MRIAIILLAAAALSACQPPAPKEDLAELASAGCTAQARASWSASGQKLSITARADGPTCEHAVTTYVVRTSDGAPILIEAYPTEAIMQLAGKKTPETLNAAMVEWIDPAKATMDSTDDLPAWADNADAPSAGGFPFYPEEGVDRAAYEALRAQKTPMLCFVQGRESMVCHQFKDGALSKVGVQTFPG